MDDARALLNSLMGADRDEKTQRVRTFRDGDFCRSFLLGLCPHDLFKNTKVDLGPCDKEHNEHIKSIFEADADRSFYKRKWRRNLQNKLTAVLSGVDRRISMNQSRVARERDGGGIGTTEEAKQQMADLKQQSSEKLKQAEEAADAGKFEESRALMADSEAANRQLEDLGQKRFEKYKKEEICEICGLIIDAQEAEDMKTGRGWHSNGKQHLGYKMIRERLKELERELVKDRKKGLRTPSPSPVRVTKKTSASGRDVKKKSRSRSRRRSRSRSRMRKDDQKAKSRSAKRKNAYRSRDKKRDKSPRRSVSRKRRDHSRKRSRSKKRSRSPAKKYTKMKEKSPKCRSSSEEDLPQKKKCVSKPEPPLKEAAPPLPAEPPAEVKPPEPPMEEPEPDTDEWRTPVRFFLGFKKL